ncbi:phage integrase SAM-like domain-containing protein [Pontibacter sp. JH31]|uniref:Phage integrase SAM-like domain-containing protein n=1 Tax=Pontibacter aquaedesilientis TaxID=2766980 RepID=A0ABR7XL87_9BACT|nr:phage integrase SAM-like domain-containing protein [Pontibacter aquaedesilientis]MBD1399040.1 phage integrase SAM-like domain-containing protein [Pontibacter aquaedesilientis]
MEINRYIRIDRVKNGAAPIRILVHYHNKRLPISTGEKTAYPDGWDEDKQRIKTRQPFAGVINQKLDNMGRVLEFIYQVSEKNRVALDNVIFKSTFEQVLLQISASGCTITQDIFTIPIIQEAYEKCIRGASEPEPAPRSEQTFLELMAQWIDEEKECVVEASGRKMFPNTIKGLNSTLKRFKAFEAHRGQPITFDGMDKCFYAEFRTYMLDYLNQGVTRSIVMQAT